MIELINEFVNLKDNLNEDFGILSLSHDNKYVHMSEKESIITLAKNEDLHITVNARGCDKYPFDGSVIYGGYEFVVLLTEDEYQENKKATASTVTNKNSDTL